MTNILYFPSFLRFGASPLLLGATNKAEYGCLLSKQSLLRRFFIWFRTFAEGAWTQVPKNDRTFGIFLILQFLLVWHEIRPVSLFDLNIFYCLF
jgi:hypothetical protein